MRKSAKISYIPLPLVAHSKGWYIRAIFPPMSKGNDMWDIYLETERQINYQVAVDSKHISGNTWYEAEDRAIAFLLDLNH